MPRYKVSVKRTDTFEDDAYIEASSLDDARAKVDELLYGEDGTWDNLFSSDGNYESCETEVIGIKEIGDA